MLLNSLWAGVTPAHVLVGVLALCGGLLSTRTETLSPLRRLLNTLCGFLTGALFGLWLLVDKGCSTVISCFWGYAFGMIGNNLMSQFQSKPLAFARRAITLFFWVSTGGKTPPPTTTDESE